MQDQNAEIYFVIIIGSILALLLIGFIITVLFLYQQRQHRQEQELLKIKDLYEQELLRSQLEIQEGTFKTIAQELHDNIGQMLSVVKLSLAVLPVDKHHPAYEGILNARQLLNGAIYDLADLTKSLHTDRIAQIGLVESIRFELESLRKSGLLQVESSVSGHEYHFDKEKEVFLFRIFQEALNNILKHSKATHVKVFISYSPESIFSMEIKDNGVGFSVNEKQNVSDSSSGVGLKSLYNRAKLIGAKISIDSKSDHGTTVTVTLPLHA